jgi:hypothetical protein
LISRSVPYRREEANKFRGVDQGFELRRDIMVGISGIKRKHEDVREKKSIWL